MSTLFPKKLRTVLSTGPCWQSTGAELFLFNSNCDIYTCCSREQYKQAQELIDSARELLDTELTALSGESYQRAYGAMVSVQMLAELEEVIQYKVWPERRGAIRKMWWQRLQVNLCCFLFSA